jgi:hypothetical protein
LAATRRPSAAVFATAVFVLSGEAIGWLAIVKGYGLTALCLLACVRGLGAVVRHEVLAPAAHPARGGLLAAGILAGLAASTRLYTLLVMPALAVYLVVKLGRGRATVRGLGRYAVGGLLGLVPLLVCCLRAPRAFLFDTLLYHAVREYGQDSLLGSASAKLPVILETMGLDAQATYGERQWLALAVAALLALLARARARDTPPSPAGVVALVLVAASLLPNPFLPQYLCLAVPLLAIEAGRLLGTLLDRVRARPRWSAVVAAAAVGYLVYNGWVGWHDRCRFLHTGVDVPGVESTDRMPRWEIATVEAVAKVIDAQHIPVGASWWPGYFVGAQTGIVVELANDFGFRAASALPPAERRRLHVVDHAGVAEMIKQRQPRLFVEGNWANYPVAALLPHYGYRLRATVKNVHVWTAE